MSNPSPNPKPSLLDQNQIFQRIYDEENDRLRVETAVTASFGTVECVIDQTNDSIAIGDGATLYSSTKTTGKNSLDVNLTNSSINFSTSPTPASNAVTKFKYAEVDNVPSGITTTVISYTVPANTKTILQRVLVAGENVAKYQVFFNSSVIATRRTMYTNLNEQFEFSQPSNNGAILVSGDIITITALHTQTSVSSFEATLQILEIT